MHDTRGARCLLAGLKFFVPRLKKIWADAAYRGQELATWCQEIGEWKSEVLERTPGIREFSAVGTIFNHKSSTKSYFSNVWVG
jgi:putative transposase